MAGPSGPRPGRTNAPFVPSEVEGQATGVPPSVSTALDTNGDGGRA